MNAGVEGRVAPVADRVTASERRFALPAGWPNAELSARVNVGGRNWHMQRAGRGPGLLLVHGTGASAHSWRSLIPLLSRHFDVLAVDLPGHGFTDRRDGEILSLENMASAVGELLETICFRAEYAAGHSAGAAIILQMSVSGLLPASAVVALNPALLPFGGVWQPLISPIARICAGSRLLPKFIASRARDPEAVRRMIASTGSHLDRRGVDLYQFLMSREDHVAAVLSMMANWDLDPLCRALPSVSARVMLVAGAHDLAIRESHIRSIGEIWPAAMIVEPISGGHLAHEEHPADVAALIRDVIEGGGKQKASGR